MYNNNPSIYPYPSKRNAVFAQNGMVATSHPLAASAGISILQKGGNAVDAAIATAACLSVVEPTSNGIGSDAFALVWIKNKLYGLNGSGQAPMSLSIDALNGKGIYEMPRFGFTPVTVPGTPGAWAELSKRFGKLPLIDVLTPAINYATNGFPLSPTLAHYWKNAFNIYTKHLTSSEFKHWFETFTINGKCPEVGEMWSSPDHADTLKKIALTYAKDFYKGEIADKIDEFSRKYGGYIRKSDLENYAPFWVEPISVNYKGYDVWEIPPNGQGLIALLALNIVKGLEIEKADDVDTIHKQIESMKLAFADGLKYITDHKKMKIKTEDLLSDSYANERRKLITNDAQVFTNGHPDQTGTVYLATADCEGNMVSYIQSNYMGFGSGLVVPNTGIALQNRGHNFSMDKNHDNCLEPGKRTLHTIIPGFVTKDHQAIGPFGVMGGFMQPQGHLQVLMNCIDFKLNPQAALDRPRWQWIKDKNVIVEDTMSEEIINGLKKHGHNITVEHDYGSFGRGEIIWRNPNTKVLVGGCEKRTDASIALY